MSEPKKKKLTGQQAELMRALDIAPEDVEANDAGYITEHQRSKVMRGQWYRWWPYLIPTVMFTVMPILFLVIAAAEAEAAFPMTLLSLIFLATAAAFGGVIGWQWNNLRRDLAQNEIKTVQGIAVVSISQPSNGATSFLEINGLRLKASPRVLLRVRHLDPYVVHYLPDSKVILSMQHIDEDENIRHQEAAARLGDEAANEATGVDLPFDFSHKPTNFDASTGQKSHPAKQDMDEDAYDDDAGQKQRRDEN